MSNREDAWKLLCEWTASDALRRHGLGVEAVMRALAEARGGDVELWGMTGLVHDFDYERHPEIPDHPLKGAEALRKEGYPEELVEAVLGHAEHTGVARTSDMAKALFACDELTGFLFACAYVQPDKRMSSVKTKSIMKKLKDKSFARAVNREDIRSGAEDLGVELREFAEFCRDALAGSERDLGV